MVRRSMMGFIISALYDFEFIRWEKLSSAAAKAEDEHEQSEYGQGKSSDHVPGGSLGKSAHKRIRDLFDQGFRGVKPIDEGHYPRGEQHETNDSSHTHIRLLFVRMSANLYSVVVHDIPGLHAEDEEHMVGLDWPQFPVSAFPRLPIHLLG